MKRTEYYCPRCGASIFIPETQGLTLGYETCPSAKCWASMKLRVKRAAESKTSNSKRKKKE
jgi:hypothetical protein